MDAENDVKQQLSYIKRPISRDAGARPVLFWFLFFFTAVLFGLSVAYATDGYTPRHWRNVAIAGTAGTAVALVVLAYRMKRHDELQWEEVEYALPQAQPPEPPPPAPVEDRNRIEIRTVRGKAVVIQPRPAAFSNWLRDVANPDTKTTFSKNEARRREWEDWQYIGLVAQLKGIGWLHTERTLNGAPDLDLQQFGVEIREWLATPLL